jgi:hypothetical protein
MVLTRMILMMTLVICLCEVAIADGIVVTILVGSIPISRRTTIATKKIIMSEREIERMRDGIKSLRSAKRFGV